MALSMGDPAGIGPELCLRLLADPLPGIALRVFGSPELLQRVSEAAGLPFSQKSREAVELVPFPRAGTIQAGEISAESGAHSFACLEAALEATRRGDCRALVTNPIHKEAWAWAGIRFPGHTDYLAEVLEAPRHAMMLTSPEITCSLVTTHIPLSAVSASLTPERILEVIRLTATTMQKLRGRARLVLPGLNPHAGEGGLFGDEEEKLLAPALAQARAEGIEITGPISPDTAFLPAIRRETEAYVCLYHDQGLIPLKTLAFDLGVNVTLGLPIVRTSVDHGTAFDIAWQGLATDRSLREAIQLADQLAGMNPV